MSPPTAGTATVAPGRRRARGAAAVLVVLALLFIALNLRPAVVAVSPLVSEIRADLGLSSAAAGLLTTLPVLCFGIFAPLAPRLSRRGGLELTLLAAVGVLVAGIAVRLVPWPVALFGGSILVGAAIAVGNVLMPAVVRRDFAHRSGPMMGAVSALISGGGALAAAVVVPIEGATGLTWRPTLALWALPALVAALLWLPAVLRARAGRDDTVRPASVGSLWHDHLAWQVTVFMGLQSLHFYALTAWIPTVFVDAGRTTTDAGLLLALGGLASVISSVVIPILATRRRSQHHLVVLLLVLWAVGYTGLLVAPAAFAALWMVLVGLGQGIGISLALTLMSLRSPDAEHTAQLSGMAQGVGYVVAASGPLLLGALHDVTDGWTVPLATLLVLLVPLAAAGLGAARDRHVVTEESRRARA